MIVVGLGNPGPGYARTRHNLGAAVVTELARRAGAQLRRRTGQIRVADVTLAGRSVRLGVPTTYMNESGRPIARLVRKARAKPGELVVCHDELDLPFGRVRIKAGGGTAGHNGLASVEASLRSRDFVRVRIGVGKPPSADTGAGYVLSKLAPEESAAVEGVIDVAIEGVEAIVVAGVEQAQNAIHPKT